MNIFSRLNIPKSVLIVLSIFTIILFFVVAQYDYLIGHDIYFHLDVAQYIAQTGLTLPVTIPYYWGDFLFGYPPLYHWLIAVVHSTTGIAMPILFGMSIILLIPISLLLVYILFDSTKKRHPLVTTAIYSVTLFDIMWPLYSGEYPRLLSFVFALVPIILLLKAKENHTEPTLLLLTSGIMGGLAAASNMIGAAFVYVILGYFGIREFASKRKFKAMIPLIAAIISSSFWWLRAMMLYGYDYFFQVLSIHDRGPYSTITIIGLTLLMVYTALRDKQWPSIFAIWLILSIATVGTPFIMVPIAYYVSGFLDTSFNQLNADRQQKTSLAILSGSLILMVYIIGGNTLIYSNYVTDDVVDASGWIETNTEQTESIIVFGTIDMTTSNGMNHISSEITGMYRDEVIPYFANRNTYTWFGYEWSMDKNRYAMYRELHKDLCLDSLIPRLERFNLYPELLWINKDSREFSNEENICQRVRNLETVFENETILIKRLQNPI